MSDPTPPFPTLHTPRLLLRELLPADVPALHAIHADAEAMRWFGTDAPADLAATAAVITRFASWRLAANPGVRWGIARRSDGRLIGSCGLFAWNRDWAKCSTGYELAADARGQGLMCEALAAAMAWGFEAMALNRIEAQIHPDNQPSIALVSGLGFQREGLLREVARWGGQFHDLAQYALLRRDWRAPA
ncbi:GNAT family N-acetyltransferase [Aquabacterium sp. OR-4]|uniref:GNAT family N-acetyltransferase n=1 Tax=Aquabacterium sp. OR-4 TaxID=2978127 RepID=UPI0021B40A19|nr:GNAT family protein [Aquabacterium sp. OR-4]MDT7837064.1 GNAT family protein [Aquabacterium sp. OR-4]